MAKSRRIDSFKKIAELYCDRSYVPYSGRKAASVVLLADGQYVPGVRIENASFSLTISSVQNALTTAATIPAATIVAIYSDQEINNAEEDYIVRFPGLNLQRVSAKMFSNGQADRLPELKKVCNPTSHLPPALLPDRGIALARDASRLAMIHESHFPVGCLLQSDSNVGIQGANVEHPDWNRILCAERNAAGTAVTFDVGEIKNVYISAPKDPDASPCGACRQVLVELAQRATVWMDRGKNPAMGEPCDQLLPYYFSGHTIQKPNPLPKR